MKPHILCATDFSSAAEEATKAALALASRLGAELQLVHVVGPISEFLGSISDLRLLSTFIEIAEHRLT